MPNELISNWIEILYILLTGITIGYLGFLIRPGRGWAKFAWSSLFQPFIYIIIGYVFILVVLPVIFYFIYPFFYTWVLSYIKYTISFFFVLIGLYLILMLLIIKASIVRRWKLIAILFGLAFLAYLIANA